jgi:hypothetical protein
MTTRKFKIYCRRMSDMPWELYGEFATQAEFDREIPHIRFLGLYIKRVAS